MYPGEKVINRARAFFFIIDGVLRKAVFKLKINMQYIFVNKKGIKCVDEEYANFGSREFLRARV